jgi:hypothetical protein
LFTKNQSLSVSNWYCWSCRAFVDAQDRAMKGKKKAKSQTQAQNKSRYKTKVFLQSLLTYLVLHYLVILVPWCSVLSSHRCPLCVDSMWHSIC